MNIDEYIASYKSLTNRFSELLENINIDTLLISKKKLESKTAKEGFWNDKNNAKHTLKKISLLEKEINDYQNLTKIHNSIKDDFDLVLYNHQSPLNCFTKNITKERFYELRKEADQFVDRYNQKAKFRRGISALKNIGIKATFRKVYSHYYGKVIARINA